MCVVVAAVKDYVPPLTIMIGLIWWGMNLFIKWEEFKAAWKQRFSRKPKQS
jgi:hypothetical protein